MNATNPPASVTRATFDEVMVPSYAPGGFIPVRGKGSRVWDQSGREYIDWAGGIAVSSVGHVHPDVVAALTEQAGKLWHVANVMTNEPAIRLAQRLCELTFAEKVFFANSGAEANEAALKLARRYACDHFPLNQTSEGKLQSEKNEIISFHDSFHGRTLFTVTVGGQPKYSQGFGPAIEGITHLPYNDLEAVKKQISARTCAVIIEPVQGESGVLPARRDFLKGLRELCDQHNALLIFDEVQSGAARTGPLYAYMDCGVTPDILTSAKGLGGGFPIGAMLTTEKIAASFSVGVHGSTYGGNALGCAVALAVLDILVAPETRINIAARTEQLKTGIAAINKRHQIFADIRASGLWFGCELIPAWHGRAKDFVKAGEKHGLMFLVAGTNVLRLAPSLLITEEDVRLGLERFDKVVAEVLAMQETTAAK
ncbi:MAG: aspartate aminotransferase family protein [Betaproteobacteria bacterium]|nr:aspartate aminotransferase family protein [Betaproteobacteria bacterium]